MTQHEPYHAVVAALDHLTDAEFAPLWRALRACSWIAPTRRTGQRS